jgi:hypothetical protein
MSTVNRQGNFEPVRDAIQVITRDVVLADPNLADPNNAVCLFDGEWMVEDTNGKAVRASTIGSVGNEATVRSFPLWMERGRTDVRAMGEWKALLLWLGQWEFNTRIFNSTVVVGSGAAITAFMQPLKVATITIANGPQGSRNYTGLVGHGGSGDTSPIVGYVSKIPSLNGGRLRVRGGNLY